MRDVGRPGGSTRGAVSTPLPPSAAYRLWAPTYSGETAVSALEDRVFRELAPDATGRRLLDVGCGTGRRLVPLREAAALAVGVDLVLEMLVAGAKKRERPMVAAGDVRGLPFRNGCFDLVWCRLVLGHLDELAGAYRELARVTRLGGDLVVSDFHAAAVAAGHARTFRDGRGAVQSVEHHVHVPADHVRAAGSAGWTSTGIIEAPAGEPERPFYERAGRLRQLELEAELPLVLAMSFSR